MCADIDLDVESQLYLGEWSHIICEGSDAC